MPNILENIKYYYTALAVNYHVDPIIFTCIHLIGTPLFIASISWLFRNYRQKKSLVLPVLISLIIYNVGNVYLVVWGKNIGWYIYAIIGATTVVSGYFTYKKIWVDIRKCRRKE